MDEVLRKVNRKVAKLNADLEVLDALHGRAVQMCQDMDQILKFEQEIKDAFVAHLERTELIGPIPK